MSERHAALALAALAALAGCSRTPRVRAGDAVAINWELSVDGASVESTFGEAPTTVIQGEGQVPPGVDAALLGMAAGEEKSLTLTPELGFGVRDERKVQELPLASMGELARGLKVGATVRGFRDGKPEAGRVVKLSAKTVTLDFNPPLAGRTVTDRVRVVSVGR